jgi:hypothetical protein
MLKLIALYQQLREYLFYDDYRGDYRKRKDTLETKKCRNCLSRVSLHWYLCPYCKHSDFSFNEEHLYDEGRPNKSKINCA